MKFVSNGPAGDCRKAQMGDYTKTSKMIKGFLVFEQAEKQVGGKQYFLFVGPDGCWRVGPDVSSYSGSVLKHPKKNTKESHPNRFYFIFGDYSIRFFKTLSKWN